MRRSWLLLTALLALMPTAALADADGCRLAVAEYKSAVSDVTGYLRRYISCMQGSGGKDDCSTEFRRLRGAQDDFESAVSSISSECED